MLNINLIDIRKSKKILIIGGKFMKRTKSLVTIAILIVSLSASLLSGCSKKVADNSKAATSTTKIKPITIKYWSEMSTNLTGTVTNLGDTEVYKNLEKKTGVHVEFIHPAAGQALESFRLLIASNDLPDCIEYSMFSYPGGPQKAIEDNAIISLNSLMDKDMPNLKKILQGDKELDKLVKTDAGKYYAAPAIQGIAQTRGLMMRKDWLDDCGLQVPTTIDDWHTALTAFKEKKGATAPLVALSKDLTGDSRPYFSNAFDYADEKVYLDKDGKTVKYGGIQPGCKELMTTLAQWYKEGLIDKDFIANTDTKQLDSKVTSGKGGAFAGSLSSNMGKYLDLMKKSDPKFDLVAVQNPVKTKGTKPTYAVPTSKYKNVYDVSITSACKNKDDVAKWLDYGYSKEGSLFFNYGIEGDTYTMVNGVPTYTDKITKYSGGMAKGLSLYTRANYGGSFVDDVTYMKQSNTYPDKQNPAMEIWALSTAKASLPKLTFTTEESKKMSDISTSVTARQEEMMLKFITGQTPMSDWDKYIKELNTLGVDQIVKINQDAYNRFLKR